VGFEQLTIRSVATTEENTMNKKGIVGEGLSVMVAVIIATVAISGSLFTGGISGAIGSSMLLVGGGGAIYSQTPYVVRKFRERKGIEACKENPGGITDCESYVKALSDEDLLDSIRDDAPGEMNRVMYMEANPKWRLGG